MDALPISYVCGLLITDATRLAQGIPLFVSKVRAARKDMDAILRELASLQLCLTALKDDDQQEDVVYSESLRHEISRLLSNTNNHVSRVKNIISKHLSPTIYHVATWNSSDRPDILQCRSLLEASRMALDLVVTMGNLSRMVDERKSILDRRDEMNSASEGVSSGTTLATVLDQNIDSLHEEVQLENLRKEMSDYRQQMAGLVNLPDPQKMPSFHGEAQIYANSLLEQFPNLHAELNGPKLENTLSPSLSVSTSTSSSVFTKLSHSMSVSSASTDNKSHVRRKCPACARLTIREDDEAAIQTFFEKQMAAKKTWQFQLEKEREDVLCLGDEIVRLQKANAALEGERQKDLDARVEDVVKEKDAHIRDKDEIIRCLQRDLHNTAFYQTLKRKGINGTVGEARAAFAEWVRAQNLNDPSMSTGAADEDGSDTSTIPSTIIQRRSVSTTQRLADPPNIQPKTGPSEPEEKIILEFSVNVLKNDLLLRTLAPPSAGFQTPLTFPNYKAWATVDYLRNEFIKIATAQMSQARPEFDIGACYVAKVSRRYDNISDRLLIEIHALHTYHMLNDIHLQSGDKLRLMLGLPRQRSNTDPGNMFAENVSAQRLPNRSQSAANSRPRNPNIVQQIENPTETTLRPNSRTSLRSERLPAVSDTQIIPPRQPGASGPQPQGPDIVISHSRTTSVESGYTESIRSSLPPGTLKASPIFEFRARRPSGKLILSPKSLIVSHTSIYGQSLIFQEFMLGMLRHIHMDRFHFNDDDSTVSLKIWMLDLLGDILRYWKYEPKRIFLQVRATILNDMESIQAYDISESCSVWVMLKPLKQVDGGHLGSGLSQRVPGDHELCLEEPDPYSLQRLSFNDQNLRRIYQSQRASWSPMTMSVRS